jgi:ferritin-like metal-binding protein YciE
MVVAGKEFVVAAETLEEQLVKYLTDAHSIEVQALAQMRSAPGLASDPGLASAFRDHEAETERHEQLIRSRLEAHGASPSRLKDAVMAVGGKGMLLFARVQPDTDGKLATHALSYEHLELAAYELLSRVAERAGDAETASVARTIRDEERAMARRLEGSFDGTVEASLDQHPRSDLPTLVDKYLGDAHALENQSEQLLSRATSIGGNDAELMRLYEDHLEETHGHKRLVEERLSALGSSPSRLKDAAMRLGGLNWSTFFAAQPDTPGKLLAFAYAFEHLEIGGYEHLRRVAQKAADQETVALVGRIMPQERVAAQRFAANWHRAADASLAALTDA